MSSRRWPTSVHCVNLQKIGRGKEHHVDNVSRGKFWPSRASCRNTVSSGWSRDQHRSTHSLLKILSETGTEVKDGGLERLIAAQHHHILQTEFYCTLQKVLVCARLGIKRKKITFCITERLRSPALEESYSCVGITQTRWASFLLNSGRVKGMSFHNVALNFSDTVSIGHTVPEDLDFSNITCIVPLEMSIRPGTRHLISLWEPTEKHEASLIHARHPRPPGLLRMCFIPKVNSPFSCPLLRMCYSRGHVIVRRWENVMTLIASTRAETECIGQERRGSAGDET